MTQSLKNGRMKQRAQISYTESEENPEILPALRRVIKFRQGSSSSFDWNDTDSAFEKITEETRNYLKPIKEQSDSIVEELGDLLLQLLMYEISPGRPEDALILTSQKFIRRFALSKAVPKKGRKLEELTLSEMDKLWEDSKALY